ncbi:hypothetical protein ACPCG0_02425 [Propionibacteriaceae bacterium Y1923]
MGFDDFVDDLDPMAAPVGTFGAEPEEVDEDIDVLSRADETWHPGLGFPDGYGVCRVWTDETGLITKVRVSASWREKLGKKVHLSMPFAQAFALVNSYFPVEAKSALEQDNNHQAKYPLSWERLDTLTREMANLTQRLEAMGDGGAGHWKGKRALGESPDKLAAIELTEHGQLGRIIFNTPKLEESRIRQITDAVVRAHADARANFVPSTYVEGERDRVQAELRELRNETLAMMRRGFK